MNEEKNRLALNPMEKYLKQNRFPWKLSFHLVLMFLTAVQVYFLIQQQTQYAFNAVASFNN